MIIAWINYLIRLLTWSLSNSIIVSISIHWNSLKKILSSTTNLIGCLPSSYTFKTGNMNAFYSFPLITSFQRNWHLSYFLVINEIFLISYFVHFFCIIMSSWIFIHWMYHVCSLFLLYTILVAKSCFASCIKRCPRLFMCISSWEIGHFSRKLLLFRQNWG